MLNINRPLSNTKVESTGKSYSDHEALAAEIMFGYEDQVENDDEKIEYNNPRSRSCTSELQLKVNCRLNVNCGKKFGLARPTVDRPC